MHTWDQLHDTSLLLTRAPDMAEDYQRHCKNVLCSYPTLSDYIRQKVVANMTGMHLTVNRFPYDVEPDVSHFVLWNLNEEPIQNCSHFVHLCFDPQFFHVCIRENQPHHRSVKDIHHYHVFVKRKAWDPTVPKL